MKKTATFLLLTALLLFTAATPSNNSNPSNRPTRDYALFFAVNDYDHWEDLANPVSDVETIAKDLKDLYGFETEIVRNPNKKSILDKIEEYRKKTYTPDAQLLIFFSGHGEFNEAAKQGFFVPKGGLKQDEYGESYIEYEFLKRRISSLPCEHILLALDACYSGTADENIAMRGEPGKRPGANADAERERYISTSLQYKTRIMLTSGAKVRTPDKSEFVAKFLAALRSQGGDDRLINIPELLGFLSTAFPKPVSSTFGDHAPGGEFLFVVNAYQVSDDVAQKSKEASATADDLTTWRGAKATGTEASYQTYLSRFPKGEFREQASAAIRNIQADEKSWAKALASNTIESYQEYLDKYPNGAKQAAAINTLRKLETDLALRRDDLAWDVAVEKSTEVAFKKYQTEFPKGTHYEEARQKIAALKKPESNDRKKQNAPSNLIPANAGSGRIVEIETTLGTMIAELSDSTPQHRDNFIKLVNEGYYNDLLFHRVISKFMIQGGDPDSRNAGAGTMLGFGGPSYTIPAEFRASLYHIKGALCASRTNNPEKKSSGSQFYVVQGNVVTDELLNQMESMKGFNYTTSQRDQYKKEGGTPSLDREYTVFGYIISGIEVIDKIASVQTTTGDRPTNDIKIKMRILR